MFKQQINNKLNNANFTELSLAVEKFIKISDELIDKLASKKCKCPNLFSKNDNKETRQNKINIIVNLCQALNLKIKDKIENKEEAKDIVAICARIMIFFQIEPLYRKIKEVNVLLDNVLNVSESLSLEYGFGEGKTEVDSPPLVRKGLSDTNIRDKNARLQDIFTDMQIKEGLRKFSL